MRDVIDNYHPDFWFTDGALPFEKYGYSALSHFYNDNQRVHDGRLEAVFAFKDNKAGEFDEHIGVLNVEANAISGMRDLPWQSGTHLGSVWYSSDAEWKSAEWVIHVLVDNVSKNGALQLNIPPKPDGTYDDRVVAILRGAGAWLKVNGEAIYGTRAFSVYGEGPGMGKKLSVLTPLDIRFTKNKAGTAVYAIVMGWPGDGANVRIASLRAGSGVVKITRVSLLGHSGVLRWTRDETALNVTLPDRRPGGIAYPIRIESVPA